MGIVKIVVADVVYTGTLAQELGSDAGADPERCAEELAELKGSTASAWLAAQYPEAELYTDVAIYGGIGRARPIEVFAYDEDSRLDEDLSRRLQQEVEQRVREAIEQWYTLSAR